MTQRFEKTVGDVTVTVQADPAHAAAVAGLFYVLERVPPEDLADGRALTLHGNLFILRGTDSGLVVQVPSYLGDPFTEVTEDLSLALWIMDAQARVLRRFGVEGQPARWDDTLVVHKGVLEADSVYVHRTATDREQDSGWFVGAVGGEGVPAAEDLERIRVHELSWRRRALLPLLGLPDGHLAIVVGDEIQGVQGPDGEMLPDRG